MTTFFIRLSYVWSFLILFNLHNPLWAQKIEEPGITSKTAFAIVVDEDTYKGAQEELLAYKNSVEEDGLGTYIVSGEWNRPDQIREILFSLYKKENSPLEGVVLVGNIPVPMIRDAQYLTSAFKMNQRIRWDRSSVPSDRYYDDFDLEFEYLQQDTSAERQNYHYYSLKAESPQYLSMDIYSARIKPPVKKGEDALPKIKDYLKKLVSVRNEKKGLDDMVVSYGHGYNSNSINARLGEANALKSQFPNLFRPKGSIKFLNFRSSEFIKFNLLSELKREGVDMAYMTGHGTPRLQIMSGYPLVSNPQPSMINVARYIRAKMRDAKDRGRDLEEVKANFQKTLGLSDKWFEDAFDEDVIREDSIYNDNMDIQLWDVKDAAIQARMVYINSCLSGSFHLDDYIAGYYPFSDNRTVVTVANSVGVLQDLWPAELMGLLAKGLKAGNWLKEIAYLETHILGDPTFYFYSDLAEEINAAVVEGRDEKYWLDMLKENNADMQALALVKLTDLKKEEDISELLKEYYFNSDFETVRMQAFQLLRRFENEAYFEVLHAARKDPYEFIRRRATYDLTDFGGDEFVKDLIDFFVSDPHSERVAYRARWALQFMNPDLARREIDQQIRNNKAMYNAKEMADQLDKSIDHYQKKSENLKNIFMDRSVSDKELLSELSTLRLYRHHKVVPQVLDIAKDNDRSESVRTAALEVLGWFTLSYQREEIIKGCEDILKSNASDDVKREALKTKNRIYGITKKAVPSI